MTEPGRGLTRRAFLRQAAWTAPALGLLPRLAEAVAAPAARPPAPAQKVVVVGAGLAGLAAAYELAQSGHDVAVLEASHRAGGRVWTLREAFADGLYAEAGALDYSDTFRHYVRYVKTFGLAVADPTFPSRPLKVIEHLRGRRLEITPGEPVDWPVELAPAERRMRLFELFQRYLAPLGRELGDPTAPGWRLDRWAEYDGLTLRDLLRRRGASDGAIELMAATVAYGYGWNEVSALHRLISDVALFPAGVASPPRFLRGGSDRLTDAFARALRARIRYGAPVTKILAEPGSVRVVFRQQGEERSLAADRVVCTAPVPALRKIEIAPALSPAKRQAVTGLEYTPVTRIFVQTRRRLWSERGFAGSSGTDLPIQVVTEQPFVRDADPVRGILECHIKGPEAERVGALDLDAKIAFAVSYLERLHPGIGEEVEGGTAVSWHADPWTGGGYAWWRPQQLTGWMPELARAEGRIHFAGEHTSALARTQEGALESGNRVAREIDEAARQAAAEHGA